LDTDPDSRYGVVTLTEKKNGYVVATVLIAILLGSALVAPTVPAFADNGQDKPKNNDPPKNNDNNQSHEDNDEHKKGKKDPDKDKDKDKKECKNGDTKKNGKYKHNCDSDHDKFEK